MLHDFNCFLTFFLVYGKHIVIVHWVIRPRLRVCGKSLPVAADGSIYVVDTASYEVTHCIRAERVVHLHALADMIVLAFKHRQLVLKVKILALFVDFYFTIHTRIIFIQITNFD